MSAQTFDAFMATRCSALARTAYLLTGDPGHAEDLVQSALIKTLRSWHRLRDPAAAETYTRTVMVRLAGKGTRRRWRGEMPSELVDSLGRDADRDTSVAVRAALAALPGRDR